MLSYMPDVETSVALVSPSAFKARMFSSGDKQRASFISMGALIAPTAIGDDINTIRRESEVGGVEVVWKLWFGVYCLSTSRRRNHGWDRGD